MEMKPGPFRGGRPSAMRAARLVAVLAAVLALGSCQVLEFIFGSVFPATIGLAKAQADLSAEISANDGGSFNLRVVQSGSTGYVIVIGNPSNAGQVAYVYDLDLSLKTTLTGLTGNGTTIDGSGNLVIGDTAYNASTLAVLGGIGSEMDEMALSGVDGLNDFNGGVPFVVGHLSFNPGSTTLNWSVNNPGSLPWTGSPTTPVTFTGSVGSLQVVGAFDDGKPGGNAVIAVSEPLGNGNNNSTATCWFMTAVKLDFDASTVPATLLSQAHSLDNIETGCIGYADGSIIAYDGKAGRFLRIDPATGAVQSSFFSGSDMSHTRLAYLVTGGYFYGFDTKTRAVTKYAAWW